MASPQVYFSTLFLSFLKKNLFFLSTTSFSCGVLANEKLCEILFSSKIVLNDKFSNYPPWLLLTRMMFESFSFLRSLQKF